MEFSILLFASRVKEKRKAEKQKKRRGEKKLVNSRERERGTKKKETPSCLYHVDIAQILRPVRVGVGVGVSVL